MKLALSILLSFMAGTSFGAWFFFHAVMVGNSHQSIDTVAMRAVQDVEQAYENQLLKEDTLSRCLRQNSKLKSEKRKDQP